MRDLTQKQFNDRCKEYGFTTVGFMGYYNLGIPGQHIEVSVYNAGSSRRSQLAYLIQQRDKYQAKKKEKAA
jgi:hypothetical protein